MTFEMNSMHNSSFGNAMVCWHFPWWNRRAGLVHSSNVYIGRAAAFVYKKSYDSLDSIY